MSARTSRNFLIAVGYILIILGILGFIRVLGPSPDKSIFGSFFWMDSRLNLLFIVTGVISFFTAYVFADTMINFLAFGIGTVAFFVGLYGLLWASRIFTLPLAGPIGNLIILIIGIWGIWSVSGERITLMRRCRQGDEEACRMIGMRTRGMGR